MAIDRFGEPRDPAGVVAFLTSEGAGWITGQTISVRRVRDELRVGLS